MNVSTVIWAQWDKANPVSWSLTSLFSTNMAISETIQSRELLGLFICMCSPLCTIVAHNTAQNRPDNFPSCPQDNHHCSDDVYLRETGGTEKVAKSTLKYYESWVTKLLDMKLPTCLTAGTLLLVTLVLLFDMSDATFDAVSSLASTCKHNTGKEVQKENIRMCPLPFRAHEWENKQN